MRKSIEKCSGDEDNLAERCIAWQVYSDPGAGSAINGAVTPQELSPSVVFLLNDAAAQTGAASLSRR